jgi:hypothetical protein
MVEFLCAVRDDNNVGSSGMQLIDGDFQRWEVFVIEDQEEDNRGFGMIVVNEGEGTVFHLAGAEGLGVNVAELFDFESTLLGNHYCLPLGK